MCSTNPINKPPMEKTHKTSDAQCIIASIARKLYMAYQESNCQKCVIAADCFNPCVNPNFRSDILLPCWKSGSHSPPSSCTLCSILSMRAWNPFRINALKWCFTTLAKTNLITSAYLPWLWWPLCAVFSLHNVLQWIFLWPELPSQMSLSQAAWGTQSHSWSIKYKRQMWKESLWFVLSTFSFC